MHEGLGIYYGLYVVMNMHVGSNGQKISMGGWGLTTDMGSGTFENFVSFFMNRDLFMQNRQLKNRL